MPTSDCFQMPVKLMKSYLNTYLMCSGRDVLGTEKQGRERSYLHINQFVLNPCDDEFICCVIVNISGSHIKREALSERRVWDDVWWHHTARTENHWFGPIEERIHESKILPLHLIPRIRCGDPKIPQQGLGIVFFLLQESQKTKKNA